MNGHALIGATVITAAAKSSSLLIAGVVASDTAPTVDVITQFGVFTGAIAVGYYMLRRGDSREREANRQAQADLKAMRDEIALMRADLFEARNQLMDALVEKADAFRQMTEMQAELTELRGLLRNKP